MDRGLRLSMPLSVPVTTVLALRHTPNRPPELCERSFPERALTVRLLLLNKALASSSDVRASQCSAGGAGWGPVQLVTGDATAEGERTDPGPMWHAKTKTLVLHVGGATLGAAGRSSTTWQLKSTDAGTTWSEPANISAQLGAAAGFRPGPAGGTSLASGRLLVAGYGELGQPWPYHMGIDGCVGVWYSDTVGESWELANVACDSPAHCNTTAKLFTQKITESVLSEVPGGGVLLSSRVDGAHLRRAALSKSGEKLLFDSRLAPAGMLLPDAGGNAGGLVATAGSLFYSNSISAAKDRTHMTVLRSDDIGSSWKRGEVVYPGPAAYSDLSTVQNELMVGLAFERNWNDSRVMTGASSSVWFVAVSTNLPPFEHPPQEQAHELALLNHNGL